MFLGAPCTGKSQPAQAIGLAAIQEGYGVLYRETHTYSWLDAKRLEKSVNRGRDVDNLTWRNCRTAVASHSGGKLGEAGG